MLDADPQLVFDVLMALARLDSPSVAVSGFKLYQKLVADGKIDPTNAPFSRKFGINYANTCFASSLELAEAGMKIKDMLIADGAATEDEFLTGLLCAAVYRIPVFKGKDTKGKASNTGKKPSTTMTMKKQQGGVSQETVRENSEKEVAEAFEQLKEKITLFTVSELNPVIRALGRRRLTHFIFDFLDAMRAKGKHN
jgi:hypothetical protein